MGLLGLSKDICLIKKYLKIEVETVKVGKMRSIQCGQVQMKVTLEEVHLAIPGCKNQVSFF